MRTLLALDLNDRNKPVASARRSASGGGIHLK
jgi:hypothetical protein